MKGGVTMENTNEQNQEQTTDTAGDGVQPEANSIIELARAEREKLEQAITKNQEILRANQEVLAKQVLGGRTEAGIKPEPVKEETPREYAKRLMDGEFKQ